MLISFKLPYSSFQLHLHALLAVVLNLLQMAIDLSSTRPCYEDDCKQIHTQWNRLDLLGQALARRTLHERRQIRETYLAMYGEDLTEHLHRALVANQKNEVYKVMYVWMLEGNERDAIIARSAIKNIDTEYMALVELYTCRKSNQLFLIKQAYHTRFKGSLDHDIITDPSHPYQRILIALAASQNSHQTDISQHIAKCDAKRLYEASKGAPGGGIDEAVILEILSKRSLPQLRTTLSSYKHIYGRSYTKSLKKDNSREFEESLRVVVKCICDPPMYYAKMLYSSIKGTTRDKSALTRVMVSRAEVDMSQIKSNFQDRYRLKLHDAIKESIQSGDYRDFLIALADAPSPSHEF